MIGLNTRRRIDKLFRGQSIACDFLEIKINEFGEEDREEKLGTLNGIFYKDKNNRMINIKINDNGKTLNEDFYTLLILKNNKSDLINMNMKCLIDNKRYEILSIDNELDIYYIIKLKLLVEGDNYEV